MSDSFDDGTVLILAPTGQDSELAAQALQQVHIQSQRMQDLAQLARLIAAEARGAILLAEEALRPELIPQFMAALAAQEKWSDIPIILMTGSGETTTSSLQMLNLFTASGNVTLLERPCRSVTITSLIKVALRARRRQYEVRALLKELASAVQQRDEFMSVASHELKTPLTSLKLQAQLNARNLARGDRSLLESPEKLQHLVSSTNKQLDRLGRLIEDMLDVSRISTGKLSMTREPTQLTALINDVVERFAPQLAEAGCMLSLQLAPDVEGVWDRYRIEQVVNNLLGNAIKYSAGKPVHVSLVDRPDTVVFTVRDGGPGIAAEDQARIFNRFERAVKPGGISGLGLGLYISKQIVESHHGSITVESAPGQGSSFTVTLPKSLPTEQAASGSA